MVMEEKRVFLNGPVVSGWVISVMMGVMMVVMAGCAGGMEG